MQTRLPERNLDEKAAERADRAREADHRGGLALERETSLGLVDAAGLRLALGQCGEDARDHPVGGAVPGPREDEDRHVGDEEPGEAAVIYADDRGGREYAHPD